MPKVGDWGRAWRGALWSWGEGMYCVGLRGDGAGWQGPECAVSGGGGRVVAEGAGEGLPCVAGEQAGVVWGQGETGRLGRDQSATCPKVSCQQREQRDGAHDEGVGEREEGCRTMHGEIVPGGGGQREAGAVVGEPSEQVRGG